MQPMTEACKISYLIDFRIQKMNKRKTALDRNIKTQINIEFSTNPHLTFNVSRKKGKKKKITRNLMININ